MIITYFNFCYLFLAWHLSGGTSELLLVRPGKGGLPETEIIGGSDDLAAGQLVDRCGRLFGLPFPAGAELDKLQQTCEAPILAFRPKVKDCWFSLSGVQNQSEMLTKRGLARRMVARFAIETVSNAVVEATRQALERWPLPVLCAGGVMCNSFLREQLSQTFECCFAETELSGDNAVGVALLAARQLGHRE